MTTFSPLKIDKASFATVRSKLVAGIGFFSDGNYRYVVADFGGHSVTVTVPSGADLVVKVKGVDEAGVDDDLGVATRVFGPASTPPFGVGRHIADTDFFRITFDVALSP
jgi:hypothetical protein